MPLVDRYPAFLVAPLLMRRADLFDVRIVEVVSIATPFFQSAGIPEPWQRLQAENFIRSTAILLDDRDVGACSSPRFRRKPRNITPAIVMIPASSRLAASAIFVICSAVFRCR